RRVTVEWHLHPALPLVEGDSLALERVFANLLHNALKFTPATGRVTISTTCRDSQVIVAIADTGPGIAPEELPLLFQKYRRTRFSLTQEGTGLGLFIVKSLVEAHGGYVTVQSVPGQGTCFRVVLAAGASPLPAQ
ncbi:MAG: sensor histidine kinase, partial [Candidatus Binatia bacterium]|nr:sensor histidine kinase [Candidatus Binatia bacterium]